MLFIPNSWKEAVDRSIVSINKFYVARTQLDGASKDVKIGILFKLASRDFTLITKNPLRSLTFH